VFLVWTLSSLCDFLHCLLVVPIDLFHVIQVNSQILLREAQTYVSNGGTQAECRTHLGHVAFLLILFHLYIPSLTVVTFIHSLPWHRFIHWHRSWLIHCHDIHSFTVMTLIYWLPWLPFIHCHDKLVLHPFTALWSSLQAVQLLLSSTAEFGIIQFHFSLLFTGEAFRNLISVPGEHTDQQVNQTWLSNQQCWLSNLRRWLLISGVDFLIRWARMLSGISSSSTWTRSQTRPGWVQPSLD
jgi:hypothetical protein